MGKSASHSFLNFLDPHLFFAITISFHHYFVPVTSWLFIFITVFFFWTLRKEGYNQSEIDLLFNTIVLPNINYALSVYAASESDLTPVQCFLDRCFKRKYTSKPVSVYDFLERQDRKIFKKVSNAKGHPLLSIMPRVKPSSYNLRKETCFKPKINTMRFKTSFINRLVFKYELAM